jgi:hypothetical protein
MYPDQKSTTGTKTIYAFRVFESAFIRVHPWLNLSYVSLF